MRVWADRAVVSGERGGCAVDECAGVQAWGYRGGFVARDRLPHLSGNRLSQEDSGVVDERRVVVRHRERQARSPEPFARPFPSIQQLSQERAVEVKGRIGDPVCVEEVANIVVGVAIVVEPEVSGVDLSQQRVTMREQPAVRTAPVSVLRSVTATLGITAPLGSEIVPVTSPDSKDCAWIGVLSAVRYRANAPKRTRILFIFPLRPLRFL